MLSQPQTLKDNLGPSTYYSGINLLRGFAALAVCCFHFSNGNGQLLENTDWVKRIGSVGYLGVELFFVISGFVITLSMYNSGYQLKKFPLFFLKRLTRLEPPYILSIPIICALNFTSSFSSHFQGASFAIDYCQLLLHLGYLIPFSPYNWLNPVYWSLGIEFQFYILIGLLFPFIFTPNRTIFAVIFTLFAVGYILVPYESSIFHYGLYFVLGFLFAKLEFRQFKEPLFYFYIAATLSCLGLKGDINMFSIGLLSFLFFHFYKHSRNKVLDFIGNISYSLYLLHVPIGGRIINLSLRFGNSKLIAYSAIALALFFSIAAAYLFYRLVEIPSIRWSKRIVLPIKSQPE